MEEFGFDFPFSDAGFDEGKDAAEAGFGDVTGVLDVRNFLGLFDAAEGVHEWGEAFVAVERVASLAFFDEAGVLCLDDDRGAEVLVGGEVDVLGLGDEGVEDAGKAGRPFHARNA